MERLNIGVLGGRMGMTHAGILHGFPDARLAAICDHYEKRLQAASSIEGVTLYREYEQMLADPAIDAVVVASHGTAHAEHVLMALEAGKHVASQIPMDYTLRGHLDVVEAVERTGLHYTMMEDYCFPGYIQAWTQLRKSGQVGDIVYMEADYVHDVSDMWFWDDTGTCVAAETAQADLSHYQRTWRAGMHPMQYITHSLGPLLVVLDDRVDHLSALSTNAVKFPWVGQPDAQVAILKTTRGAVLKILLAFSVAHPSHLWYSFLGTDGSGEIARGLGEKPAVFYRGAKVHAWEEADWTHAPEGPEEAKETGHGGIDYYPIREFVDLVVHGKQPTLDLYRSVDVSLPGLCGVRSLMEEGVSVKVPDLRPGIRDQEPHRSLIQELLAWEEESHPVDAAAWIERTGRKG